MKKLTGLSVCGRFAAGTIVCIPETAIQHISAYSITTQDLAAEKKRLQTAVQAAQADVAASIANYAGTPQPDTPELAILQAQQTMLCDQEFLNSVFSAMETVLMNADYVLKQKLDELISILQASGDPYLCERAVDIQDAYEPVFSYLNPKPDIQNSRFAHIPSGSLLAARLIKPSEALALKKREPCGILMEEGGITGHIAIIARAWNIPMMVGITGLMNNVKTGMQAILDSEAQLLITEPDEAALETIQKKIDDQHKKEQDPLRQYTEVYTQDGIPVHLTANIAFADDIVQPLVQNSGGIGLFRSEFLFLESRRLPNEEEQYTVYRSILERMGRKPVIIRTFDAGADKMLAEQEALAEKNALLGWRAVRYCLDRSEIFKTQLRALIRAGCYGNLHILVPMISDIKEIKAVRALIAEAEHECSRQKIPYKKDIPLGIMIEVPAAAIAADMYAPAVDFFSIGTNDLIQYTVAADRENTAVAHLADCFHPAVLRLIRTVIQAEPLLDNKTGGFVSMCGEMASREEALPLLLGMGLRKFSMTAQKIPAIAKRIENIRIPDAEALYAEISLLDSPEEIRRRINQRFPM